MACGDEIAHILIGSTILVINDLDNVVSPFFRRLVQFALMCSPLYYCTFNCLSVVSLPLYVLTGNLRFMSSVYVEKCECEIVNECNSRVGL